MVFRFDVAVPSFVGQGQYSIHAQFTWKLILGNPAFSLSFEFLICTFCCYILGQLGIIMLDYPSHYEAYNSFVDQGSQDPHFMVSACAMCSPHVQLDHATLLGF